MRDLVAAPFAETFVAGGGMHGDGSGHIPPVEDGHRQGISNADQVTDVDEAIDARYVTFLLKPPHKRLSRAAIFGRIRTEAPKSCAPGR